MNIAEKGWKRRNLKKMGTVAKRATGKRTVSREGTNTAARKEK